VRDRDSVPRAERMSCGCSLVGGVYLVGRFANRPYAYRANGGAYLARAVREPPLRISGEWWRISRRGAYLVRAVREPPVRISGEWWRISRRGAYRANGDAYLARAVREPPLRISGEWWRISGEWWRIVNDPYNTGQIKMLILAAQANASRDNLKLWIHQCDTTLPCAFPGHA